ncbi:G protein-coupled glucose receptor regulating Gpa2-domain-containing protein [Ustulina deusta]|nr:G protein-coupled glucose receptor regulating Gpa2-domain-containing protein [Ustulina deusta]
MAPLQQLTAAAATSFMFNTYDGFIMKRDTPQSVDSANPHTLAVMCVSLSFAAISVIAALFTFYWFVRMRRGFRQDMIMLLIQSDMAKALWLLISPLVYFITEKPLNSSWAFCQVSGFFLSVTIEASDIAVLLIAIHAILFVFKRQHPGTTFDLQPYRRVAYTLWATLPIILAAIVPITGDSFVDNGPHCYLPMHPSWYLNTLAWVPRYIIFGSIIVTYTGLYLYVDIRYRRFGEDQRRASTLNSASTGSTFTRRQSKRKWRSRSVPLTPQLTTHGLLDSTHVSMSKNDPSKSRQYSLASTVSTLQIGEGIYLPDAPERVVRKSSIAWNLVDFGHDGPVHPASNMPYTNTISNCATTQISSLYSNDINNVHSNAAAAAAAAIPAPEPAYAAGGGGGDSPSHNPRGIRRNKWKRRLRPRGSDTGTRNSLANITAALRQGPPRLFTTTEHPDNEEAAGEEDLNLSSPSSVRLPTSESEAAMRRARDKMQRQMRLLFVYPVIYLLTWIAPFVAHTYATTPPTTTTTTSSSHGSGTSSFSAGNSSSSPFSTTSPWNFTTGNHYLLLSATLPSSSSSTSLPIEPLALRIASIASLCIGPAVDCVFFSAWERPWRHLRGGFWENMARRLRVQRVCGGRGFSGRSRDERVVDERAARMRRERERVMRLELRCKMAAGGGASSRGSTAGGKSARSEGIGIGIGIGGGIGRGGSGGSGSGGSGSGGGSGAKRTRTREWWDVLDEATL